MRIFFFGTSDFGIQALEKLQESGFELSGVVTQPDKPVGRKKQLIHSPVKQWALDSNVPVYQPEVLEIGNWKLEIPSAEVFVVASYGKIIPKEILDIPKLGTLNIHPSLLPKYRGPSPIQTAILNGDQETGVTIIKLDEEMDHGPILGSTKFKISNSKIDYKELHDELAELGADLLLRTLPDYTVGKIEAQEQDHSKATFTKMITKEEARIDWSKSAKEIDQMVRAYSDWPVAWTTLDGKRLKIYISDVRTNVRAQERTFGEMFMEDDNLLVSTGQGSLEITKIQLEGKQKMNSSEFVKGYRNLQGKIFV